MAHVEVASHQHGLHRLGQIQQAQQVRRRAARAPHGLRRKLVGEAEFLHQALQALRFFQRVQIFALDVFNEPHGGGRLIGHITHQHRHAVQPGQFGGPEAALASDDFVDRSIRRSVHKGALRRGGPL